MSRLARIAEGALTGGLAASAAGVLEGLARLSRDASLRDSSIDALQFLGYGVLLYGPPGIAAGMLWGALRRKPSRVRPRWGLLFRCVVALLALGVALYAVVGEELVARETPPAGADCILLITVDTLRADALKPFRNGAPLPPGLERARTPELDALAASSWVFLDASTPIPKTPQAIASLMTGNSPSRHRLRTLFEALGEESVTLAELLEERGWTTRAVITNGLIDRSSGMAQGFDRFRPRDGLRTPVKSYFLVSLVARISSRAASYVLNRLPSLRITPETAEAVTDRAIEALESAQDGPFFLWVHYLDPHWTYWPPEPWRTGEGGVPEPEPPIYGELRAGRANIGAMIHDNAMPPREVESLVSLYASEVSYLDREIGRLLEAVRRSPMGSSTIVAFTSDHGESLGEDDYYFSHGDLVHQACVRVPLILKVPGEAPRAITSPVGLIDVAPTLLDLVGIDAPEAMDGKSMLPTAENDPERLIFGASDLSYLQENPWVTIPGEAGKVRFVRQGRWKLVRYPRDLDAARRFDPTIGAENLGLTTLFGTIETTKPGPSAPDRVELFDLATDPSEQHDLSKEEPARAMALTVALDAWLMTRLSHSEVLRSDEEALHEQLKSLGYVN